MWIISRYFNVKEPRNALKILPSEYLSLHLKKYIITKEDIFVSEVEIFARSTCGITL